MATCPFLSFAHITQEPAREKHSWILSYFLFSYFSKFVPFTAVVDVTAPLKILKICNQESKVKMVTLKVNSSFYSFFLNQCVCSLCSLHGTVFMFPRKIYFSSVRTFLKLIFGSGELQILVNTWRKPQKLFKNVIKKYYTHPSKPNVLWQTFWRTILTNPKSSQIQQGAK